MFRWKKLRVKKKDIPATAVVILLTVYVLTSRFVKTPLIVKRNTDLVIIFVTAGVVLSVFMDQLPVGIVLVCAAIMLVSLSRSGDKGMIRKGRSPSSMSSSRTQDSKNKKSNLKTQSNIFNKLNYDLYLNEMGDQYNIQGVNEMYPNGYETIRSQSKFIT